jgi:hypothetical protein
MLAKRIAAGLLLGVLVFAGIALALHSHSRHQSQQPEHKQPAVAEQQDRAPSPLATSAIRNEQHPEGKKKEGWQNKFFDHLPDWFVALFTGLLVYVTHRLVKMTDRLRESTERLWEAGERQIGVAQEAAEAAKASTKIANDSLTKLQRAFVGFKNFHRGEAYVRDPSGTAHDLDKQFVPISIELENSGATPTRQLRTQVNFDKFPSTGLPADFRYLDAEIGRDPVTFVIGPKTTAKLSEFGISFRTLEEIRSGVAQGYVWGWVEYDDVFDDTPRHRTEFCFRIAKVTPPISKPNMEWDAHGHHNGMDDDCLPERWQTVKGGAFREPRRPKWRHP